MLEINFKTFFLINAIAQERQRNWGMKGNNYPVSKPDT
jgi:hypothetical protein